MRVSLKISLVRLSGYLSRSKNSPRLSWKESHEALGADLFYPALPKHSRVHDG
jgi:hypothetical protein